MDALLQSLLTYVLLYKYAAIFVILFLGALPSPVPSATALIASFVFAEQGYLNPVFVALAGFAGYVSGDVLGFWLTRAYGRKLLERLGLGRLLRTETVKRLEASVDGHPITTVFWSRFATAISPAVNILAGLAQMPIRTFILIDIVGNIFQVAANFALGWFFNNDWTYLVDLVGSIGATLFILLLLAIALFWSRHSRKKRKPV